MSNNLYYTKYSEKYINIENIYDFLDYIIITFDFEENVAHINYSELFDANTSGMPDVNGKNIIDNMIEMYPPGNPFSSGEVFLYNFQKLINLCKSHGLIIINDETECFV